MRASISRRRRSVRACLRIFGSRASSAGGPGIPEEAAKKPLRAPFSFNRSTLPSRNQREISRSDIWKWKRARLIGTFCSLLARAKELYRTAFERKQRSELGKVTFRVPKGDAIEGKDPSAGETQSSPGARNSYL